MNWGIFVPIAALTVGPICWAFTIWVRVRHGYPLEGHKGQIVTRDNLAGNRKMELLTSENERLVGQITRLEGRIATLERIATDPAGRTAREIDALR
ncbi:MAG: hypothetical protein WC803_03815 [Sphingomonas sp.]|jgi:hypothetical protein